MADRIESLIREKTKGYASEKYWDKEIYTREATERKVKASRYFSPLLKEHFGEKYPTLDWDEEAALLSSMSTVGPDMINRDTKFLYGVSIYILDAISSTDNKYKVQEILDKILPPDSKYDDTDEKNDYYFFDLYEDLGDHPYYSEDLLSLVTRVLSHRNSDFVNYDKGSKCLYLLDKATVSNAPLSPIEGNPKTREIFEKLIDLIPPQYIEEAKEAYKSLFWTLIDRYLEARGKLKKHKAKIENLVEYGKFKFKERALNHIETKESSFFGKSTDTSLADNMQKLDEITFIDTNFNDFFCTGMTAFPSLRNRYTRGFEEIEIDDPYKIVSGYLFLLDEQSEYAWLLGPAMSTLSNGANLLPWKYDFGFSEDTWEEIDKKRKNTTLHSSSYYTINLNGEMIGIPGYKHNISAAQLLFAYTNTISPRFTPDLPFLKDFETIEDKELVKETLSSYSVLHSMAEKIESDVNDADTSNSHFEYVKELRNKVETLQSEISENTNNTKISVSIEHSVKDEDDTHALEAEIKRLKKALDRERHIQSQIRNDKIALEKEINSEREELYSLRELIFSRDNEEENSVENKKDSISFPISTAMRHVVIGGHEEWLKKIKAMVPDVTFLGDRVPSKELLKHTDFLWFQTHAGLSHSLFYKIIDDAKTLKLPVKYFTSSSAKGNAIQLLEEERNRSKN